jgi:hypothetical protein
MKDWRFVWKHIRWWLFTLFILVTACNKDSPMESSSNNNNSGSQYGERWTYQVVGTSYTFTLVTEAVQEKVGGYSVYRLRDTQNPAGLGEYFALDPVHVEVEVATDWWDVNDPSTHGRYLWEPPVFSCQYGDTVGTSWEWVGTFGGSPESQVSEVLAYESITIPLGTFANAMKAKVTTYEDSVVANEPLYIWVDKNIGILRAEEVNTGSAIVLTGHSFPKISGVAKTELPSSVPNPEIGVRVSVGIYLYRLKMGMSR